MRREGVRPWTATVAASAFVFFGSGAESILGVVEMAFVASLVFGLTQLILSDHDGPFDRRDWIGLGAGLLGVLCSGIAVAMIAVVGVAALLRRGWRIAALHAVPPAAIFFVWWIRYGRNASAPKASAREIIDWCRTGIAAVFGGLAQITGLGWVLAAALVIGLVLIARAGDRPQLRARVAMPLALIVGAFVFLISTAATRAFIGARFALSSRYLYILAAFAVPVLAMAADAIMRRRRIVGLVVLAVLLIGVPHNISKSRGFARTQEKLTRGPRQVLLSISASHLARDAPPTLHPVPGVSPFVTMGWIRSGVASGRIPKLRNVSPMLARTNTLRLSLMEVERRTASSCRALHGPIVRRLRSGAAIGLSGRGRVLVSLLSPGERPPWSAPVPFGPTFISPSFERRLVAIAGPITIRISPMKGFPVAVCG
jgi:hypothetical protein